jgi:hypothetical protein
MLLFKYPGSTIIDMTEFSIDQFIENYQKLINRKEQELIELIKTEESDPLVKSDLCSGRVWACYNCIYADSQ